MASLEGDKASGLANIIFTGNAFGVDPAGFSSCSVNLKADRGMQTTNPYFIGYLGSRPGQTTVGVDYAATIVATETNMTYDSQWIYLPQTSQTLGFSYSKWLIFGQQLASSDGSTINFQLQRQEASPSTITTSVDLTYLYNRTTFDLRVSSVVATKGVGATGNTYDKIRFRYTGSTAYTWGPPHSSVLVYGLG